jgi:hypothetical protein
MKMNDDLRMSAALDLMGIRVYSSPHIPAKRPRVQLRPGLCSPGFEGSMNAWLRDFFGEENYVLFIGAEAGFGHERIIGNPAALAILKQRVA